MVGEMAATTANRSVALTALRWVDATDGF